jgi:hypothetical protein
LSEGERKAENTNVLLRPRHEHRHPRPVLALVEHLLTDEVVRLDPLNLCLPVGLLLPIRLPLSCIILEVITVDGTGRGEGRHREPELAVRTLAGETVDGAELVFGKTANASAVGKVVEVDSVCRT